MFFNRGGINVTDCEWTDTCGIASDCSCEEMQPFTVEDLTEELEKTSVHALAEVVVSTQDEATSIESDTFDTHCSNTSS